MDVAHAWQECRAKAHGLDPVSALPAPFPMTVEGLKSVAAPMELGGRRSRSNCATWAGGRRIGQGCDWTRLLARELTQAGRSRGRGLGPSVQRRPAS